MVHPLPQAGVTPWDSVAQCGVPGSHVWVRGGGRGRSHRGASGWGAWRGWVARGSSGRALRGAPLPATACQSPELCLVSPAMARACPAAGWAVCRARVGGESGARRSLCPQVCDSDTVLDPACTAEMLRILEADPRVGGVGGDVQVPRV